MTADETSQMQKMSAARWIYVNGKHSSEPFLSFPIQKCLDKYIKKFDYSVICRETLWWCDYDKFCHELITLTLAIGLACLRRCVSAILDIGSLSNNDATVSKMSLKKWSRTASNFIPLFDFITFNSSNLGSFCWSWILKDYIEVQRKKKKVVALCSRPLQNVKLGSFTS